MKTFLYFNHQKFTTDIPNQFIFNNSILEDCLDNIYKIISDIIISSHSLTIINYSILFQNNEYIMHLYLKSNTSDKNILESNKKRKFFEI